MSFGTGIRLGTATKRVRAVCGYNWKIVCAFVVRGVLQKEGVSVCGAVACFGHGDQDPDCVQGQFGGGLCQLLAVHHVPLLRNGKGFRVCLSQCEDVASIPVLELRGRGKLMHFIIHFIGYLKR